VRSRSWTADTQEAMTTLRLRSTHPSSSLRESSSAHHGTSAQRSAGPETRERE